MSKPLLSVAMCTYNGSRYIREQLESIATQTRLPDELVVCDDGSQDDTMAALRQFAGTVPFNVRIFENANRLGPAKNFERVIGLCEGDIIALSDQDDVWRPEKLAVLSEALDQHPAAVYAFSDARMVDESRAMIGRSLWDAVGLRSRVCEFSGLGQVEILLRRNLIPGAAMAFRAGFRGAVLPVPSGWMHDYWIALIGSVLAYGVPINEVLFDYRRHSSPACGWRKKTFGQVIRDSLRSEPGEAWAKLDAFRSARSRVLTRTGSAVDRAERIALLEDKEAHLLRRARARSATGLDRVIGVLTEAATGRYRRFSRSWSSIIRDL
jgi:glycosyltransferase involved in cell wall biosynthesis